MTTLPNRVKLAPSLAKIKEGCGIRSEDFAEFYRHLAGYRPASVFHGAEVLDLNSEFFRKGDLRPVAQIAVRDNHFAGGGIQVLEPVRLFEGNRILVFADRHVFRFVGVLQKPDKRSRDVLRADFNTGLFHDCQHRFENNQFLIISQ